MEETAKEDSGYTHYHKPSGKKVAKTERYSQEMMAGGCRPHNLCVQTAGGAITLGGRIGLITLMAQRGIVIIGGTKKILCQGTNKGTITFRNKWGHYYFFRDTNRGGGYYISAHWGQLSLCEELMGY